MWIWGCSDDTPLDDPAVTTSTAREYGNVEVTRLAIAWKQRTEAIINHYHFRK